LRRPTVAGLSGRDGELLVSLDLDRAVSMNGTGRTAIIIPATSITPEHLRWKWPGRLAIGALTNVVGLPDHGKSLISTDITARLTTVSPMPPAPWSPGTLPAERVLILTHEDSLATTMVPRLIEARADLAMVDFVQMVQNVDGKMSMLTLADDLDVLTTAL